MHCVGESSTTLQIILLNLRLRKIITRSENQTTDAQFLPSRNPIKLLHKPNADKILKLQQLRSRSQVLLVINKA